MKIGLINLPIDSNFGGNLQRFALVTVLKSLGFDVVHLKLMKKYSLPLYKVPFSFLKRVLFNRKNILIERRLKESYYKELKIISPFYEKYIPHTESIYSFFDYKKLSNQYHFDGFVVGSDQIWRKSMSGGLKGLKYNMLAFILNKNIKKLAYGVSLGSDTLELNQNESHSLKEYYKQFIGVSVREASAISIFKQYKWNEPTPVQVLDPTLLLKKEDYDTLIMQNDTNALPSDVFCYILDMNNEKRKVIDSICSNNNWGAYIMGLNLNELVSIEQWLRFFRDAKFVITDSYHGLIFSIIFHKPFKLLRNERRGNSRFDSLIKTLHIDETQYEQDWNTIDMIKNELSFSSFQFLKKLNN